jgi:hypothetical protein
MVHNIVFEHSAALVDHMTYIHKNTAFNAVSETASNHHLSPCFHVNSVVCFSHTGPSSGIYFDLCKMLCIVVLYSP